MPKKPSQLPERKTLVLKFVTDFIAAQGYGPTTREIMAGCQLCSTSYVKYHLDALVRKGALVRGGLAGSVRTLRLPDQPTKPLSWQAADGWTFTGVTELVPDPDVARALAWLRTQPYNAFAQAAVRVIEIYRAEHARA